MEGFELDDWLEEFLSESEELLEAYARSLSEVEKGNTEAINEMFRAVHTLKGLSGMLQIQSLGDLTQRVEAFLDKVRKKKKITVKLIDELYKFCSEMRQEVSNLSPKGEGLSSPYVRIRFSVLEELMDLAGELVVTRTMLSQLASEIDSPVLEGVIERLEKLITSLQEKVNKARLVPIGQLFSIFPPLVREAAVKSGKKVDLVLKGEETLVDRKIIEVLEEPLVHLLRNAVDHGIESPEERKEKGKKEKGEVKVRALTEGDYLTIEVQDDGQGLNLKKIQEKAVRTGFKSSGFSSNKLMELIFNPGFTTRDKAGQLSGWGVGLDVVKEKIISLRGEIVVETKRNQGTAFKIRVPLTLSVIRCLLFSLSDGYYAFPLSVVEEVMKNKSDLVLNVGQAKVFKLRGKPVSFFDLSSYFFGFSGQGEEIVVVKKDSELIGVLVDRVVGYEELVIKPLESEYNQAGFIGTAVLGTGDIVFVLDVSLLKAAAFEEKVCLLKKNI